jgi:hypothetical protein
MADELAVARLAKARATTALANLDAAHAPVAELVQEVKLEGWHDLLPASVPPRSRISPSRRPLSPSTLSRPRCSWAASASR